MEFHTPKSRWLIRTLQNAFVGAATVVLMSPLPKKMLIIRSTRKNTHGIPVVQSWINSTVARGEVLNPDDTDLRLSGARSI